MLCEEINDTLDGFCVKPSVLSDRGDHRHHYATILAIVHKSSFFDLYTLFYIGRIMVTKVIIGRLNCRQQKNGTTQRLSHSSIFKL